jgi:molybdate transport system ATP-binding protein
VIRFAARKRLRTAEGEMELSADLELGEGEFAALFGRSGAGKTTLLRMLAGLARPDEGRIEAGGETWFDSARGIDLPPQRRRAGMVFQDYALFPHLTVRDNLRFALPDRGRDPQGERRVEEILETFRLGGLRDRRPDTLSGGQKQRVALARALVVRPQALLLDEPLSALDLETRLELQDEIAAAQRRFGVTTLLVSHDMAEIFRLTRRVLCLERGRIVRSGRPEAVFAKDRLSGKFKFTGVLLAKEDADAVVALTLLVGGEVVKVTALREEAAEWAVGDRLRVASKAFNPLIFRIDGSEKG